MLRNLRIGPKLILVGTIIIAVPLIAVGILAVRRTGTGLKELSDQQLLSRSSEIAAILDGIYTEELKLAVSLAHNPAIVAAAVQRDRSLNGAGAEAVKTTASAGKAKAASPSQDAIAVAFDHLAPFKDIQQLGGSYEAVNMMDANGIVFVAATPASMGVDAHEREYFKKAMTGKANIGSVVISKVTGQPITPIAVPISSDGKVVGVFTMMLRIDFLGGIVGGEKVGKTGYVAVFDGTGMTIAHPNTDFIMKLNVLDTDGLKDFAKDAVSGKAGVARYLFRGVWKAAGYAPVKSTGWSVMVILSEAEYLAAANDVRNLLAIVTIVSLLAAFVIFVLFARSITVPLGKGVAFAQTVAAGDFTHELNIDQRDEIGVLAQALNGMSKKLADMVGTIQENAEQLAASSEQISSSAQKLSEGAQS